MPTPSKSKPRKSSRERVRSYRQRMRAQGLHPVQIWLPDVNSKAFIREARRQSYVIGAGNKDDDDQAFVDSISEFWDE